LLFQVLRDDFISLFVRGCWLVSFFFTPIYMFILVFIVMFGPKKGFIGVYSSAWSLTGLFQNLTLLKSSNINLKSTLTHRFQFTIITSKLTTYVLFTFWIFFFFFGEILLLVILNYSVTVDTIMSTSFFNIKQHIIFYISSMSNYLSTQINFYIFFLTSSSIIYLLNLSFQSQYWLFRHTYWNSTLSCIVVLYLYFSF
jgi:hypothetical protein